MNEIISVLNKIDQLKEQQLFNKQEKISSSFTCDVTISLINVISYKNEVI